MIVRFLPEHCASDSNAAEQKSKSALFSLIVLLPRGRGSVSQSGGSSLELETKVAEDYAKCYNHGERRRFQPGEGPRRGLLCVCKTLHILRQPSLQALVLGGTRIV